MAERALTYSDPAKLRLTRERLYGTQKTLADAMNERLPLATISARTISNLEAGQEVDAHFYWAVLAFVGLHTPPYLGPRVDQPVGAWVRELRECHGISKSTFCGCTAEPGCLNTGGVVISQQKLSRLEDGERKRAPSWQVLTAVEYVLRERAGISTATYKRLAEEWSQDDVERYKVWLAQARQPVERRDLFDRVPARVAGFAAASGRLMEAARAKQAPVHEPGRLRKMRERLPQVPLPKVRGRRSAKESATAAHRERLEWLAAMAHELSGALGPHGSRGKND